MVQYVLNRLGGRKIHQDKPITLCVSAMQDPLQLTQVPLHIDPQDISNPQDSSDISHHQDIVS